MDLFTYQMSADYQRVPRVRFRGREHCALEDRPPAWGRAAGRRDPPFPGLTPLLPAQALGALRDGASSAFLTLSPGEGARLKTCAPNGSPRTCASPPAARAPCHQSGSESRPQGEEQTQLCRVELSPSTRRLLALPAGVPGDLCRGRRGPRSGPRPRRSHVNPHTGTSRPSAACRLSVPSRLVEPPFLSRRSCSPGLGACLRARRLGSGPGEASEALRAETQRACQRPPSLLPQLLPDHTLKRGLTSGWEPLRQRISV